MSVSHGIEQIPFKWSANSANLNNVSPRAGSFKPFTCTFLRRWIYSFLVKLLLEIDHLDSDTRGEFNIVEKISEKATWLEYLSL